MSNEWLFFIEEVEEKLKCIGRIIFERDEVEANIDKLGKDETFVKCMDKIYDDEEVTRNFDIEKKGIWEYIYNLFEDIEAAKGYMEEIETSQNLLYKAFLEILEGNRNKKIKIIC